jgi:hypothetical protein
MDSPRWDVGDALRLQRVHQEDQGHRESDKRLPIANFQLPIVDLRLSIVDLIMVCPYVPSFDRAANDAKQGQSGQKVHREVEGVVSPGFQSAECIIHRQRNVHHRPLAGEQRPEGPKRPNPLFLNNANGIVEQKNTGETVGVGRKCDEEKDERKDKSACFHRSKGY